MKYDFENYIDRSDKGASKWYFMKQAVPEVPEGIVPFTVADIMRLLAFRKRLVSLKN